MLVYCCSYMYAAKIMLLFYWLYMYMTGRIMNMNTNRICALWQWISTIIQINFEKAFMSQRVWPYKHFHHDQLQERSVLFLQLYHFSTLQLLVGSSSNILCYGSIHNRWLSFKPVNQLESQLTHFEAGWCWRHNHF